MSAGNQHAAERRAADPGMSAFDLQLKAIGRVFTTGRL
jgi:hypothetical protein